MTGNSACGTCPICKVAGILVVIGALNWGLVGIFNYDLVANFLGVATTPTRVVYGAVGVAGLLKLLSCFNICPACKK